MLTRLARTSYRHRRLVLLTWLVAAVLAVTVGSRLAGDWAQSARLPGTESQHVADVLHRELPAKDGDSVPIVFGHASRDPGGIEAYRRMLNAIAGVTEVGPLELAPQGDVAMTTLTLLISDGADVPGTVDHIRQLAEPLQAHGVEVAFGSGWFDTGSMPASEGVGLLAAIVVLLVAFGSVVAMGLPILTALVGILIGVAGVGVVANVLSTPDFSPQVATMLGIGVGVDYALFIVTRYRAALGRGQEPEEAVVEAMTTAGRAVAFAGCTVLISVLGMVLMGLDFLYGLAVGTSLAVAIAVAAALTLLPAMLGFAGHRIDRLHVGRRRKADGGGLWGRWAAFVQRRPMVVSAIGFTVLVALALPVAGMRLGVADAGNDPATSTTRHAYDLVSEGFGAGVNGPMFVVVEPGASGDTRAVAPLLAALRSTPGVASVGEPLASPSGRAVLAQLVPTTGPQDARTVSLLHHLRDDVVPGAAGGARVSIGGQTAGDIDFATVNGDRLPRFIGAVLVLSFLLLLVVFRSVLVPLKAVAMNLLSIGAAYGVLVAIFQWGWGGGLLGVSPAPIEPWLPMLLFAIVFGLSMDYEVFLLSAVREEYDRTGDNRTAVTSGLTTTARVITAAALIMVSVFASFVFADDRALKLVGVGLSVAVLVDATVVRIMLVPATMELLGRRNWWLPGWLDRLLPTIDLEGPTPEPEPERELVGAGR